MVQNKDVPLWGFGLNRDGQLMCQPTQETFTKPHAVGAMLKVDAHPPVPHTRSWCWCGLT